MAETTLKPLKGRLLLSVPFLNDFFFGRSVILLTEHNQDGSAGLIINKPLHTKINTAIKDFPEFNARLFLGGPVENKALFYLHTVGELLPGSLPVMKNLYWGGDYEALKQLIAEKMIKPGEIRFFVGYSGWSPKQLNNELKQNSWLVTTATPSYVMSNKYNKFWQEKIISTSSEYAVWAKFHINPSLN